MKKIFVIFCIFMSLVVLFRQNGGQAVQNPTPVRIYYVDRRLHKLIPTRYTPKSASTDRIAAEVAKQIISPKTDNPEILHLLPDNDGSIAVKVENSTAVADISPELSSVFEKNPETEKLIVYQIVNSLTSIDGITAVRFTIGGKVQRDFLGFLDMREIFTPDYDV